MAEGRRKYFRTSTKETADGLIYNFSTNTLPANQGVRECFGIIGDDEDEDRLYDAMKWAYEKGYLTREKLIELKDNGAALTEAVNVNGNPFSPVTYETMGDSVREVGARKRADAEAAT